jgi:hypothetical protein
MNTVMRAIGGQPKANQQAGDAQKHAENQSEEDAALQAANQSASQRLGRIQGRRSLAYQGADTGLATTMGGS